MLVREQFLNASNIMIFRKKLCGCSSPDFSGKMSSADVKTIFFCFTPDFSGKMELCRPEDFFCSKPDFSGKMELCGREDFFIALHLILVGKLHECTQGSICSHIFQKGAIAQKKKRKTPGL